MTLKSFVKTWLQSLAKIAGLEIENPAHRLKELLLAGRDWCLRRLQPALVKLAWRLWPAARRAPVKLNLACGSHRLKGFLNLDWRTTKATDFVCDIRKLPFPAGSVEEIHCYHAIEHLSRAEAAAALREWRRVLKPGGKLVVECPDFEGVLARYQASGDEAELLNVFGAYRFPGDGHKWGYTRASLQAALEAAGFVDVQVGEGQDYHAQLMPCLRAEARKP